MDVDIICFVICCQSSHSLVHASLRESRVYICTGEIDTGGAL